MSNPDSIHENAVRNEEIKTVSGGYFGVVFSITFAVIMGIIFFLAVTPIGLILRVAGKDRLNRKIDRGAKSYWIERRPPGPPPETMINQS